MNNKDSNISTNSEGTVLPNHNDNAQTMGLWGAIKKFFSKLIPGPSIDVSFKSGYYESIYVPNNPDAFKCNPGDGICEITVVGSMNGQAPITRDNLQLNNVIAMSEEQVPQEAEGWGRGRLGLNTEDKLAFAIEKASMTVQTYDEHYADGILEVPEDWELQEELRTAIGLPTGYTIPKGDYPVQLLTDDDGNEVLYIVF